MRCEGGKIDWACHANDCAAAIHDVMALEDCVAEAVAFCEDHPDETLIVVTGDHETGGLTIEIDTRLTVEQMSESHREGLVGAVVDVLFLGHVLLVADAEDHPDETLIVVTGDHETGGLTIGYAETNYDTFLANIARLGARHHVAGITRRLVQIDAVITGARRVEQAAAGKVVEPARNKLLTDNAEVRVPLHRRRHELPPNSGNSLLQRHPTGRGRTGHSKASVSREENL